MYLFLWSHSGTLMYCCLWSHSGTLMYYSHSGTLRILSHSGILMYHETSEVAAVAIRGEAGGRIYVVELFCAYN